MKNIYTRKEQVILSRILSDLYMARNITLDEKKIVSCLRLLDKFHNVLYNDSNGEATDADMARRRKNHETKEYNDHHSSR